MRSRNYWFLFLMALGTCLASFGCHNLGSPISDISPPDVPRENHRVSLGDYLINPPDILLIKLVRGVPLPPYKIQPLDDLYVQVKGTPLEDPIKGVFHVEPEGVVRFGPTYGSVPLVDLTIDEAEKAIEKHLKKSLKEPQVSISLELSRGVETINGSHLVRPDGTVNLGIYGRVSVAGLTQELARAAIEEQLAHYFLKPNVSLDMLGFNSSFYYIIFDGGGAGEQVVRLPYTGSDTVLDAIGQVNGLPAVASKRRVWLARPYESRDGDEVLPIDWRAITQCGRTATNYQLFPGDRIYVAAQPLITTDTFLARALAPVERVFGIVLLGTSAINGIKTIGQVNGSNVP
jgi:polysaccharide export outer membrane protein